MNPRVLSLALAAMLALPGPTLALSCLRPDAVRLYEFARDSEDLYQVVLGHWTSIGPVNLPEAPQMGSETFAEDESNVTTTRVRVTGMALGATRFDRPFDREVTLELGCLGPWCSDPPARDKQLIFAIRVEGDARYMNPGVCSENSVQGTSGGIDRLLDCHVNGHCPQQF